MENGYNLKNNAVFSMIWKLLERGGSAVVSMIVQVIMAHLLAPEQFGMLSIMLVFVNVGNVIVQSGMNTALIQAPEIQGIDCSTVFWMSFTISIILFLAVYFAAPGLASFYSMPDLIWPLRALAMLLVINSYNAVQVAIITRNLEMRKIFNATFISSAISALLGIGCALVGLGVWALVVQQISYQLVNCFAHAVQLDWRPRFEFSGSSANKLFGFGVSLLASGLLSQVYLSLSDLVIGRQFSVEQLGLVSQGKKYPQTLGNILDGAIQPVMLSAVSRVQDDRAQVKKLVRRALKTSSFLVIPSMVLFAVLAPSLVPLLLGSQWSDSVWFMQAYCFVYAMLPIHSTNLQALNGVGRSDLFLKLEVIKKVIGVLAIAITALLFQDVYLMVGSYILTGIISTFINAWPNKRVIGYSYLEQIRDIAPAVLLAAAAATAGWIVSLLPITGLLLILLQIAVFAMAYFGFAAILRVEELSYLVITFRELLNR